MISNHYFKSNKQTLRIEVKKHRSVVTSLPFIHVSLYCICCVLTRSFRLTLVSFCVIIYYLITDIDWIFSVNIKFIAFVS